MDGGGASLAWLESSNGERTPVRGSCLLGRSAACGLVLADAKASRQHAMVHGQEQGEFWLIDLGSANGTYLNGRRLSQPCRLSDGDEITAAGFTFTFRCANGPSRSERDSAASDATIHEIRNLTCWLVVADIQDSTQLLRKLPGEEAPRITGRWLSVCSRVIGQHQGTINKFLGDGFLAYWPAGPGVAASVAGMLVALKDLQEKDNPPFRVVAHYGQVMAGGAGSLGEESLTGNEVNFVFRLEKLAASLGEPRLMSGQAQAEIKSALPTALAGEHELPGFAGKFPLFSF